MRRHFLLLLLVGVAALVGCSREDPVVTTVDEGTDPAAAPPIIYGSCVTTTDVDLIASEWCNTVLPSAGVVFSRITSNCTRYYQAYYPYGSTTVVHLTYTSSCFGTQCQAQTWNVSCLKVASILASLKNAVLNDEVDYCAFTGGSSGKPNSYTFRWTDGTCDRELLIASWVDPGN